MNEDQNQIPERLHYEDGNLIDVGIPDGHHPVTNVNQLDNNPTTQQYIAQLLTKFGAPEKSWDYLFGWQGVDLDDENTLWVYYEKDEIENPDFPS